jgi:HTH-type transcriptional regulator / antitoxin HigA
MNDVAPIRPVRNDADHEAALQEISRLWGAPAGSPDADRLEVLATLVDAYEDERWPIKEADPVEVLHYLIEDGGHTQAELAEIIGSRPRASEVLSRKRALTIEMIDKICKAWRLPHSLLAVPYGLAAPAKPTKAKKVVRKKNRPRKRISSAKGRRSKRAA